MILFLLFFPDHNCARLPASLIAAASIAAAAHGIYHSSSESDVLPRLPDGGGRDNNSGVICAAARGPANDGDVDMDTDANDVDCCEVASVSSGAANTSSADVATTAGSLNDSGMCCVHDQEHDSDSLPDVSPCGSSSTSTGLAGRPGRSLVPGNESAAASPISSGFNGVCGNSVRRQAARGPVLYNDRPSSQEFLDDLLLQLMRITSIDVVRPVD